MGKKRDPKISLIIATKNRSNAIKGCLDAALQSFLHSKHENSEIVVVDNGSTDQTQSVVAAWANECPLSVVLIYEEKLGLSAARNAGIAKSNGDLLIFTDDDCQLSQEYITDALHYWFLDNEEVMRSGSVILGDMTDLPITVKIVDVVRNWKRPMSLKDEGDLLGGSLIGCNIVTSRNVVNRVGMFDVNLGAGTPCRAAEDTDYFYRAYLAGIKLEVVPNLVISHFHGRKNKEHGYKLLQNYTIGNGALVLKYLFIYPNFSRHFYWTLKALIHREGSKIMTDSFETPKYKEVLYQLKGMLLFARSYLSNK